MFCCVVFLRRQIKYYYLLFFSFVFKVPFSTYYYYNIQHMATATGKARCVICEKEKSTLRCEGCLQTFCYNHVADHRQQLSKQFDEIEVTRDLFRQTLTEQTE